MNSVFLLVPLSLALGFLWVMVFLWTLDHNQYTDLEGSSQRFLHDDDRPLNKPDGFPDGYRDKQTQPDPAADDSED